MAVHVEEHKKGIGRRKVQGILQDTDLCCVFFSKDLAILISVINNMYCSCFVYCSVKPFLHYIFLLT